MRKVSVLFITIICVFILSGCSEVRGFIDYFTPSDKTLNDISDPNTTGDLDGELDKYKEYYDEKTGEAVTETQFRLYKTEDTLKVQGFIVAVVFWIAGFVIRFVVKKSTKIRRIAFFLELFPVFYFVLVYALAFIADAV